MSSQKEKGRRASYSQANQHEAPIEKPPPEVEPFTKGEASGAKKCILALKRQPSQIADDGCNLLQFDETDPSEKQFFFLARVLFMKTSIFGFYAASYDFYWMVVDFEPRAAPGTLVFYSMTIQVAGVMLLMTCWQRQLAFEKFFHYYRHARDIESEDLSVERAASIKRNSRRFWIVQSYVLGSAVMFAGMTFMGRTKDLVHQRFSAVFYYPQLVYARPMMMIFYCTILNVALHTYICLTNAIYWEARKFNRKLISLRAFDRMDMRVKLETLIRHHSTIHRAVRELDSIYQIYAFFVIAITIPATLFVMLMIFSRKNALEIILSLPALAFCLYEYYGIMYPARLHEELNRSKATLCMNHHVWVPYEKGVNKLAQTLVMHVEQANLGISLWGFAIVTKPLILTTVSVLMTCLAFLMELRPRPGQSIMGRNNFTMSGTNY